MVRKVRGKGSDIRSCMAHVRPRNRASSFSSDVTSLFRQEADISVPNRSPTTFRPPDPGSHGSQAK